MIDFLRLMCIMSAILNTLFGAVHLTKGVSDIAVHGAPLPSALAPFLINVVAIGVVMFIFYSTYRRKS